MDAANDREHDGSRNLALRATPHIIVALDILARSEGLSLSSVIRRAVIRDLAREPTCPKRSGG